MEPLKPRDKVTQHMTRDGLTLDNQTTGESVNVSSREAEQEYTAQPEGAAEKILERADELHDRHKAKKAAKDAGETVAQATGPVSRLQFTAEERASPELAPYIKKAEKRADQLEAAKEALPKKRVVTKETGYDEAKGMLPPHAPPSFSDRSILWNSVEQIEKSNNSQLAREIEIALPVELSREEQTRLVREYCSSQFVSKGMCADFNIHDTGNGNPHAHILLTMRPLDEKGTWAAKSKKEYVLDENGERVKLPSGRYKTRKVDLMDWNRQENADLWRKAWADLANDYLERSGSAERIDHRSHAERGIEELPTVHMGVAASQMEKKGIATDKGEINRMIQKTNRLMREIRGYIDSLKEWLAEVFAAKKQLQAAPHSPDMPISRSVGWKLSHGEENAAVKPSPIESSLPERSAPGASRKACASLSKGYTNRRYGRFSKNSFFMFISARSDL